MTAIDMAFALNTPANNAEKSINNINVNTSPVRAVLRAFILYMAKATPAIAI